MIERHLTFRQIEAYLAKRLPPEQIPALQEHAETCSGCRVMLMDTVIAAGAAHLTEKQAVDFVAGLAPDSETALLNGHIESCASCAAMVADLEEFRESLPTSGRLRRRAIILWLLPVAAGLIAVAGVSVWSALRPRPLEPKIVAQLRDADGVLQLSENGTLLSTARLPADAAELVKYALRSGRLPEGPPEVLTEPRETLRSSAGTGMRLRILSPNGVHLISDRPEFRWAPLDGAWDYRVTVVDEDLKEIAASGPLKSPSWVPETPLPRLRTLLWQVTAIDHGVRITAPAPPEPSPRFAIVSEMAAQRIKAAQTDKPLSRMLLAILYSQAGLRDEAKAEIAAVASQNPGSALANSLRDSLPAQP